MRKSISGNISIFINSLGLMQGDDKMLSSIVLVGTSFEYSESNFEDSSYYKFTKNGVEYLFEERKLSAIFFFIKPNDQYDSYSEINSLINGINGISKKENIIKELGLPDFSGAYWIKYKTNDCKYIHFEFSEQEDLVKITVGFFN